MIKNLLEIIIGGCAVITLVAFIMLIREGLLFNRISHLSLSQLPVKNTTFCQMVLDWCHENITLPNTRKPTLRVSYYTHKKKGGVYYSDINECVIYINSYDNILGVTNAILHEYVHSCQRSKTFDKMYEKYQREIGYEQNPFELQAREIAKKYEQECLIWVHAQIFKS